MQDLFVLGDDVAKLAPGSTSGDPDLEVPLPKIPNELRIDIDRFEHSSRISVCIDVLKMLEVDSSLGMMEKDEEAGSRSDDDMAERSNEEVDSTSQSPVDKKFIGICFSVVDPSNIVSSSKGLKPCSMNSEEEVHINFLATERMI
ncbi:uncharacterized protein A4U43_C10F8850 [Asparagus officinalis]|uniref:Uncharacterized protein n=1 Tax=Asparagus officinalis TaxID=4686 RepID=A0A5P1E1I6_ASPOF|nr:uncharacterized protein A4U43_C10F8850 [Asparagus officinalis]